MACKLVLCSRRIFLPLSRIHRQIVHPEMSVSEMPWFRQFVLFILARSCQNTHMRYWTLSFAFVVCCSLSVSAQGSRCHDPRLREADIGGDTIYGAVSQNGKPLRNAQVKVYSSTGGTSWVWRTNQEG